MRVLRLKESYPTAKVELWCTDEHRLGLEADRAQGVVAWSPVGERPPVRVHQRYEWTYLYAFAPPNSGEVHWLILPTLNAEVFSVALKHFAREVGAGSSKRVLLVLDNAGWHTAKNKLRVPEGIHLEFLRSHSPELQPAERLWPLSDEAVANRYFEAIEELQEALVGRCMTLRDRPELIRSYIRYRWWSEAA
jgi:transposase